MSVAVTLRVGYTSRPMWRETFAVGPLGANCTLLADEQAREALVIDPGGDAPEILTRLAKWQLRVTAILHTHAHIDHIGASGELRRVTGAPVLLHPADEPLFVGAREQAALFGLEVPEPCPVDRPLADGDTLHCGNLELVVLHTPGHSAGSVSFHVATAGRVVVGDTLFAGGIGRTDLFGGSFPTLVRSIRDRLYTLPPGTRVIAGHGPETTIGRERVHNPFVRA